MKKTAKRDSGRARGRGNGLDQKVAQILKRINEPGSPNAFTVEEIRKELTGGLKKQTRAPDACFGVVVMKDFSADHGDVAIALSITQTRFELGAVRFVALGRDFGPEQLFGGTPRTEIDELEPGPDLVASFCNVFDGCIRMRATIQDLREWVA